MVLEGCRLDSESFTYQYAFADDLLETWNWSEMFAGQPELERYFNAVADHYDLRKDIEFNTRVTAMTFDETTNDWTVVTDTGKTYVAHTVVATTGILSAPIYPQIPGIDTFAGETYHTALWPKDEVSFKNKRVIVVGTGASGVQIIPEVAKDASALTVFQRTPNWVIPLRNRKLSEADMAEIRSNYDEMFPMLRGTWSGFIHTWDEKRTSEYTPEALTERFEEAWNGPGFAKWWGLPADIATEDEANQKWCDFIEGKIRATVTDPAVADLLVPDHPFGGKRVPCGTDYFETYNRDNVTLHSIDADPILEVTHTGVKTAEGNIDADMIIFATGFEVMVGALNRIDITGVGGKTLRETWADGPVTYLGIQVSGFPNLFIVGGPHGKGGHGNSPRCGEGTLQWVADLAAQLTHDGIKRVEADPHAEEEWTEHVHASASGFMLRTKNAFFGDNIPGRKRVYLAYTGALPEFDERLRTLAATGYPGLIITK